MLRGNMINTSCLNIILHANCARIDLVITTPITALPVYCSDSPWKNLFVRFLWNNVNLVQNSRYSQNKTRAKLNNLRARVILFSTYSLFFLPPPPTIRTRFCTHIIILWISIRIFYIVRIDEVVTYYWTARITIIHTSGRTGLEVVAYV